MAKKKQKSFDLEDVYDAEISPLMAKVIEVCKAHKMPMFATFLYMNDLEGDDGCCTTNLMFEERPIPEKIRRLAPSIAAAPMLRMTVKNGDGTIQDTVIIP